MKHMKAMKRTVNKPLKYKTKGHPKKRPRQGHQRQSRDQEGPDRSKKNYRSIKEWTEAEGAASARYQGIGGGEEVRAALHEGQGVYGK